MSDSVKVVITNNGEEMTLEGKTFIGSVLTEEGIQTTLNNSLDESATVEDYAAMLDSLMVGVLHTYCKAHPNISTAVDIAQSIASCLDSVMVFIEGEEQQIKETQGGQQ